MSRKLLIIPGHGAGDSGATGGDKQEAILVRQLAARMKAWGGSNVKRAAYGRDYYADKGILKLRINPKKWRLLELHMDWAQSTNAKGGHVIVDSRYKIGSVVKATAKAIVKHFPGRAQSIYKRDNLANPKRAYSMGYYYTLVECGFISNKRDREYFVEHMDEIAKDLLRAHGIKLRKTPMKVRCPW